jgi:hypothetical protein
MIHRHNISRIIIFTIIVGSSVTPEIPITQLSGVDITLRIEDIALPPIFFMLLLVSKKIRIPNFYKPVLMYLIILLFISLSNIILADLSFWRFLFYFLKKVELILIGIVLLQVIVMSKSLKFAEDALLLAAFLNGAWAFYQIATGDFGSLLYTADMMKGRYGTSLIGQPTVLSSGGYYIPAICLATSRYLSENGIRSVLYAILAGMLLTAMGGAVSRASILGAIVGVTLIFLSDNRIEIKSYKMLLSVGMFISAGIVIYIHTLGIIRRFSNALRGVSTRINQWIPLLDNAFPRAIFGWGAGGVGSVGFPEAHNQFIREFITGGIAGLSTFILSLLLILRQSFAVSRNSVNKSQQQIANTAIGTLTGYVVISIFQDAFLNVTLARMFWLVVGMLGAATLIQQNK